MTGVIATIQRIQFFNAQGQPLAGGKLYTYAAGTTTPASTYQDQALTIKNENPIPLDSTGSCMIWLDPAKSYKFVLKSKAGVTQPGWPVDNVSGAATLTSLQPTLGLYTKLSELAESTGAALAGWANKGTKITVEQALDILFHGVANVRNPRYAGGAQGGGHDDTAAFQAAIDSGAKIVYAPADDYSIGTITIPVDVSLIGDGMRQTKITSRAIGASLIRVSTPDGLQVGTIRDMQLIGNNLTGASGNGHAINFVDPSFGNGAYTPQGMTIERVWIRYFRGQESRDNSSSNKISSAGIICVEGLQNIFRDVLVHNCGHGIYLERAQTNKIENCTFYQIDKAAIVSFQCVGTVISKCDIASSCLTGTTDAGYPTTDLGTGGIVSCQDELFVLKETKVKNTNGVAQVYLNTTNGAIVEGNWLRSDADINRAIPINHALYAVKCPGIQANKNTFSHVLGGTGTTPANGKPKLVRFATDYINGVFSGSFCGNTFVTQSGLLTEYRLLLEGLSGNTCVFAGWDISGNRFGTPLAIGTATVTDVDILVQNCAFTHSRMRNNVHYAQTNVTLTRGVSGVSLSANNNLDIGDNLFKQDGGTISDNYHGLLYPTRRLASGTFDPPNLAAGAVATTTLAVFNALVGEPVQVYFTVPLQGVIFSAWVSAPGVVTIQAFNPTGAAVDLASGSVGVIVSRTSVAEFDPS
jgi:hypothetical protein